MNPHRWIALLVTAALAPVGLVACGDDDDDDEGGGATTTTAPAETTAAAGADIPTEFTGEFLQIRGGTPAEPSLLGAKLKSDDGTTADLSIRPKGRPAPPSGSVDCGGETFDQGATDSASVPGELKIKGLGNADLEQTTNVTVTEGPPPPTCDERSGTWTGTSGELAGRTGEFTLVGRHEGDTAESTLTLTEN